MIHVQKDPHSHPDNISYQVMDGSKVICDNLTKTEASEMSARLEYSGDTEGY